MRRINLKRPRESVITRADRAREAGEWELASRLYLTALDRTPRNPAIWVQYGHALKELGQPDAAVAAYRRAIADDPKAADPYLHLGHVLKLLGRKEEAESNYLRCFALDGSSRAAALELAAFGWSQVKLTQLRQSRATNGAAQLNGGGAAGGKIRLWRGRRDGGSTITQADRARDAGELELAARLYRKALNRKPRNPPIWVQYGHVLKESGRLITAEAAYRTAISYDRDDADACLQLGHVLKLQGRTGEAQTAYLRAAALDPSSPDPLLELESCGWPAVRVAELGRMLNGGSQSADDVASTPMSGTTSEQGSRSRQDAILFAQPKTLASIVAPVDWTSVHPHSQVIVRGIKPGIAMDVRIVPYGEAQSGQRRPLQHIPLRSAGRDLAIGRLGDLPPGAYTIELMANGILADSGGFHMRGSASGAWRRPFADALATRHPLTPDAGADDVPLFSVTTTIYDTAPEFLFELRDDIRFQSCGDFEWLLLDNGSREPEVVAAIKQIADSDQRFRYFRVENNIHIIPGNRYLLERARGQYIVPIDSDDRISSFALAVLAEQLRQHDMPDILFSDEAKANVLGEPTEYMWRPRYSRLSSLSTVPAAHIQIFRREMALAEGVYGEAYAQGSHDWDTLMRLTDAGARVASVHECLYAWRIHPGSAALTERAKDYIISSQRGVIEHSLARRGLDHRFSVEFARPGEAGAYRVRRRHIDPRAVEIDFVLTHATDIATTVASLAACRYPAVAGLRMVICTELTERDLGTLARAAIAHGLPMPQFVDCPASEDLQARLGECQPSSLAKIIVNGAVEIATPDWIWDAVGAFELDDKVGVVGGAVVNAETGNVLHMGWALDEQKLAITLGTRRLSEPVRGLIRQAISAVWGGLIAIRQETITRVGPIGGIDDATGLFGLEYGLRCRRCGIDNAFDPAIIVRLRAATITVNARTEFASRIRERYGDLLKTEPYIGAIEISEQAADDVTYGRASPERSPAAQPDYQPGSLPTLKVLEHLAFARPLNLVLDPDLAARPTLNVILPVVRMISTSGGPNTAYNLAYRLAMSGIPVRLISGDHPPDADCTEMQRHILYLCGARDWLPTVEICDASDRSRPLRIGCRDIFLATAWWTAQMVMRQLPQMAIRRFFYFIQDYEPILVPGCFLQALALETYEADFIPIVNHPLLHRFFSERRVGRFADPDFAARALVVKPAVDRQLFRPREHAKRAGETRRLLFYARPTTALRNLFEIGVLALHTAAMRGVFDDEAWEFCGMGDEFAPIELTPHHILRPMPWVDLPGYARQMRESDVLLSLMFSPHPSYPPLEMAACGGLVVTNSYETKTSERLQALSNNIMAPGPNIDGIADTLAVAVGRLRRNEAPDTLHDHPSTWSESLSPVVAALLSQWRALLADSVS